MGSEVVAEQNTEDSSPRPKYQRVRDHVYAEIHAGRLGPGNSLPTEAKMAELLGLSRQTVRQAFAELENAGVIVRIRGRGTFIATEQERQARLQLDVFALIAPELRTGSYPSLIHGFEEASAGHQHQTVVGNSGNDVGKQADLILQMIDKSVGGVAIVPATSSSTPVHQIRQLQRNKIPVVFCHRAVSGISAPSVIFRGREIGMRAGKLALEYGHRRMAIMSAHRYPMVEERAQGLRDAFAEGGGDPDNVVFAEYGALLPTPNPQAEKSIQKILDELLDRPDRPTAIFCGNAPDAEQVYLYAQAKGLQIPRDLSLIYFGTTWREHGLAGRISAVAVDEHELGVCAARLLYEMRSGKRSLEDDEQIVFPVSELPGETLGPAPLGE